MNEKPALLQLQMIYPPLRGVPAYSLPSAYVLRAYRGGDDRAYMQVMRLAGFVAWGEEQLNAVKAKALPGSICFVEHVNSGTIVATACALANPSDFHAHGGELGWVASHPQHRGMGLGAVATASAVSRFIEAGYTDIFLRTDDVRLPALKTYLKMGWQPFIISAEMPQRWRTILDKLQMPAAFVYPEDAA